MLYATHVHPHDVRDEGADQVIERIAASGIKVIAAETGTLAERHPYPHGELPHNPRHEVVITRPNLEVPLRPDAFTDIPIRPRTLPAPDDYILTLQDAAQGRGVQVIPWIKGLNGSFAGDVSAVTVRTLRGDPVPGWLCPSAPETEAYLVRLVTAIVTHYRAFAVLLDRVRYPDWSGETVSPDRIFSCFCPTCRVAMSQTGIDGPRLELALHDLLSALQASDSVAHLLSEHSPQDTVIGQWIAFRRFQITRLVERIREGLIQSGLGHVTLWLNLWSPAFAWLLGQDAAALGSLCHGAKHFPYHRLGGGADLAGLVHGLVPGEDATHKERVFQSVLELFDLPYQLSFAEFQARGFPVQFVQTETARAKAAFGPKPIFTGIQMWDVPNSDIIEAAQVAKEAGADGYFFYCYGWATLDALETVGNFIHGKD